VLDYSTDAVCWGLSMADGGICGYEEQPKTYARTREYYFKNTSNPIFTQYKFKKQRTKARITGSTKKLSTKRSSTQVSSTKMSSTKAEEFTDSQEMVEPDLEPEIPEYLPEDILEPDEQYIPAPSRQEKTAIKGTDFGGFSL